MPPKLPPKVYQIAMKTHKLSIMATVSPATTIASLKEEALSALVSDVNQVPDVPKVTTVDDFELCRAIKDKGKLTGDYEILDVSKQVKESKLSSWEALFIQFRDPSSGNLLPVTFTLPDFLDEDEEMPLSQYSEADYPMPSTSKGKRKADPDD